ncbi:MAG: Hsp33 family molecular chaperone HslO [Myxococcota bacterium]
MRLNRGVTLTGDRVLRGMTDDGALRTITARTTDSVRGAIAAQDVRGPEARALGELMTAAVLYRETMAPTLKVQVVLRGGEGSGQVVADSFPGGIARGLVQRREGAPTFQLGAGAMLQMMRSLPNGELHRGVVEVPAWSDGGINEGLMAYMQQSEQIVTMARVAVVMDDDAIVAAGGYLVQLLPEAPDREGPVRLMAQRLEDDFSNIGERLRATDASPDHLLSEIFYGMEHTRLGDSALRFGCECSRARVMGSLATLGRSDLEHLLKDREPFHMHCDWCGTDYRVEPAELQGLLMES